MSQLVRYDAACRAVAECKSVDEAKDIRDKSIAMAAYARQAKNKSLEADALEIRMRATRKLDQLRLAQKQAVGLATGGWKSRGLSGNPQDGRPTLNSQGIDKNLAHQARTLGRQTDEEFEATVARAREDVNHVVRNAVRATQRDESDERKREREIPPENFPDISERYRLILSDIGEADIDAESVDCIITDPPYPEEFIDLYAILARQAAKWLKPGGSLLAMAGQTHLPRVLSALECGGLSYQWCAAYLTPGGQAVQIFPRKVNTFWKPVFWYVKGEYAGEWIGDVARSEVNDNDKRFHHWGQSESGIADLVRRFSKAGDVICDPFLGGGTTGVVALGLNRYFVGIEKAPETFAVAKQRIGGAHAAMVA